MLNHLNLYTDCWTSGNPGPGGWRVVSKNEGFPPEVAILDECNYDEPHTNNWYELQGIYHACKYASTVNKFIHIYTDSQVCLTWINSGRVSKELQKKNEKYAAELNSIIQEIRSTMDGLISLHFISGGDNPADYKRRHHG